MINCRAANNCSVLQSIFRRFSFSNGDLRVVNNLSTNAISVSIKFVEPEKSPVRTARLRSQSFGSSTDYYKETIRSMSGASDKIEKTNRLILEKSPYLLQHASNPVDWFPWGQEAFDKAKSENKLIFLSVGYSTCHWCHVMEKESFENPSVAAVMNAHFVNIKVDREERPDVDKLYMSFVTATVGGGGWPMSVFLTPDLKPLAGGTYFPPEDRYGRPGFKTVLGRIAKQWEEKRGALMDSSEHALQVLKKVSINSPPGESLDVPSEEAWKKCFLQLSRSYEADFGGFNDAPKFPQPANFDFLFHMYSRNKTSEEGFQCLEMCLHTLRKMAYGGIHDHVNKGFARYSVDDRWHVPHFEKMLYDQAQLAVSYCDAFVLTKDAFFGDVVHDILEYVARDLSHPEGGFYGAEDADSYPFEGADEKKEGAFCVWERHEILRVLGDGVEAEVVEYHYNVKEEGNVRPAQDPHGELLNKNVLVCFGSYEDTARKFDLSVEKVKEILEKSHRLLYEERRKRPRPHVDTKIVTAWNGLMISGYAKAGFVFKEQPYIDRAMRAAAFIRRFLYSEEERSLLRCCYKGEDGGAVVQTSTPISGFLDDYAFLIRGLLDLYEASLDADWLQWAETLQEQQDEMFWDEEDAGYFTSPKGDASILIRGKEDQDGAEPCGNSVSVHNLIRLAVYLQRQDLREKAGRTLAAFAPRLRSVPIALPEMTSALLSYHNSPTQVFIAGESDSTDTQALLDVVRARFLPGRVLALADGPGGRAGLLYSRHETLARLRPVHGKPAAYVCRNFACSLPVTEPHELATSLDANGNGNGAPKEEEDEKVGE